MKFIYLVHEVCEDDWGNDEDNVIRAFTNYESACLCVEDLKKTSKNHETECANFSFYVSRIDLED